MYSRIYQITTAPVTPEEYLSDNDFCEHWFTGSIADYVDDGIDRSYELGCFRESLEKSKVAIFADDGSFMILPGGKEAYFSGAYKNFAETVKKAAKVSLAEFSGACPNDCASLAYLIKNSFCEKFGPYVSSDEFDTIPLDEFIRDAAVGETYHIGGILDYHW